MKQHDKKEWQIFCDIGSNHNGDLDRAKKIIQEVAKIKSAKTGEIMGVKFQLFSASALWANSPYSPEPSAVAAQELPIAWIPELIAEGRRHKLQIGFTAFDNVSIAAVKNYAPSVFIKISSFDILREKYIAECAEMACAGNHPLHLSTGGAVASEIETALQIIQDAAPGLSVILYHCVSEYPAPPENCKMFSLMGLEMLARKYYKLRCRFGWSDHTHNIGTVCRSMIGGGIVELHIDLDDGNGAETQHGHCWRMSQLQELMDALDGYHLCARSAVSAKKPDLRADPMDGKRPLLKYRK